MPINNPGPSSSAVANTRAALSAGTYAFAQLPPASQYPAGTTVWTTDRGQYISNGSAWAPTGSLAGSYTYATLPSASTVTAGASAWTSDRGEVYSNGTSWVVAGPIQSAGNRSILIGDSLLANHKRTYNVNTTNGFVVSNGVVTVNTSTAGNNNAALGNYVNIQNLALNGVGLANPLSGTCVKVTQVDSLSQFRFSATYGGQTLPDGDYSTLGSPATQWSVAPIGQTYQNSWFPWMNAYLGSPFTVVSNFAMGGTTSSDSVSILNKILAGPTFDYAFIGFGTNDINQSGTAAIANAAVTTVYNNFVTMINAVLNYGAKPVIAIPPPIGSTFAGQPAATTTFKNVALLNLREKLLELARTDSRITAIDLMKTMMLGTSTTGDFIAGYVNTRNDDSVHPTPTAGIALAKNEIAAGTWYNTPIKINDREPVSIIDDSANNSVASVGAVTPNILPNGLFKGNAGTGIGGIVSGTVPDNWQITGATGTAITSNVGVTTGLARTAITSTYALPWGASNATNWGYAWAVSGSGTAIDQGFTLQSSAYTSSLQVGNWYQFGITVKALADAVNMQMIGINFFFGTGLANSYCLDNQSTQKASTDGISIKNGDVIQLVTPPYYLATAIPSGSALIQVQVKSLAAGWSCNFEFSSAYVRAVPSPYA